MTNADKLNSKIKASGIKKEFLAGKLGITPSTLSRKISNNLEFKSLEINELCKLLEIEEDAEKRSIFFN